MTYRVVIAEPASASGIATSSAIDKLEDALDFTREFVGVLRIEDAADAVAMDAGQVNAWCAARQSASQAVQRGPRFVKPSTRFVAYYRAAATTAPSSLEFDQPAWRPPCRVVCGDATA